MSHTSRLFDRVPIDLPNRSGFNLDHENGFTATCGTLVPCIKRLMSPNETVSIGVNFQCQLPPMVTDFYGKVDAVIELFFVPLRLLWGGWEHFITYPTKNPIYPDGTQFAARPTRVPLVNLKSWGDVNGIGAIAPGSLADYLGCKQSTGKSYTTDKFISALPFLAYHRIYDDWYRDTRVQAPVFVPMPSVSTLSVSPMYAPSVSVTSTSVATGPVYGHTTSSLGDGVNLLALRQRNWSKGYFTSATPNPQNGGEESVEINISDNTGSFTIGQLRQANSIQKWKERNNFSNRYADQIYGQFGVYPSSAKMDRAIYLGRVIQNVYSRSVFQTAESSSDSSVNNVVGSKKASSQALGEGSLIRKFTATEHGYIMGIFSLVPHAVYSSGISRDFDYMESEDFPFPLLAGMGDQQILNKELTGLDVVDSNDNVVFGWIDRYAEHKYIEDQCHGLMRDGSSLSQYMLQRTFPVGEIVELGSEFLQIPISALDDVQAVATSTQGFSCWVDLYTQFKLISTLPAYSVPTLADMRYTHTGHMSRGGTSL